MNPPVSKGPEYDEGFRDGYHQRGVDQVAADLFRIKSLTQDDIEYVENCLKQVSKTA